MSWILLLSQTSFQIGKNNNCESLNHIMKLDAKWKTGSTPKLIELIKDIVTLHYQDFRRALYGSGNYRLVSHKKNRFAISKDNWRKLKESEKKERKTQFYCINIPYYFNEQQSILGSEWHILVKYEYRHRILRKIMYKNTQFHENPITCNSAALWRSGGGAVAWDW